NAPRFHPYIGRSPVPTPSPGASAVEVKEERLTPSTPEILDLDSQKVLNSNGPQQNHLGPLPPMWRPHEQFPSPNTTNGICSANSVMGPSPPGLRPPSTGIGPSSSGLGPSPSRLGPSPSGLGPSPSGLGPSPSGLGPSPSGLGPSSTGLVPHPALGPSPSGLGLSPGLNLNPSVLGPSQMSMLPPMQQAAYGAQHTLPPNHQILSPVSNNSVGFPSNNTMSSYYPQGLSVSSGITSNPSVQFASNPSPSPSSRDAPPTEYPSNVKRAKSFKCEDCNKWFTSHGHLKRHYNTTLHKNMTKLNGNSNSTPQATTADITRPPILSPSSKSIGESSTTSSHDEESNLSTADSLEPTTNTFQPTASAFQPPPSTLPNYSTQSAVYPGPSTVTIGHMNPTLPHYSQAHSFPPEQPLTAPTMYHGHFSTNPTSYAPQPPVTASPFFLSNNYINYPQQGGLHGPGFHSMSEYPGPSPVDSFNSFRLENERIPHHINPGSDSTVSRTSPEPAGDTGSEASMDSSESSTTGPPVDNYKCHDCNKTFNRMCYLTQHRSTYHEGEKPFKCGTCGKRFTDEVTFTDHQGKHAGEKPYKCEVCPKQFNHKTDLRRHMCLHTGEKPFSCEQCGKGFIRKDHMLKHFQTHRKKALAAAANAASSHPSMPPNPQGYPSHPGLPPPHGSLPHPPHGPRGHPHVVAPTVY
ncbi:UNVERIFIED_CONTAM: hypothetical protein GTU68_063189, partial [Idotea baltica]|nr:hypothetical protein [Idotea baltica]